MNENRRLLRASLSLVAIWTIFFIASFSWNYFHEIDSTNELANNELETSYKIVEAFRGWVSSHGGVYVKENDLLKSNQTLKNDLSRDIETVSGQKLTLINTPYLLRDIESNYLDANGSRARMVSSEPVNPLNKTDKWEAEALNLLSNGTDKVTGIVIDDKGQDVMRLIRPIFLENSCLECHPNISIKVGGVFGGLSTSISMKPYYEQQAIAIDNLIWSHIIFWILGLVGIFFFYKSEVRAHVAIMNQRSADQASQAKSKFLSSMSHEFRTPLNSILGFSQLLQTDINKPLDDVQKENVDHIYKSGMHLLELVNQILDLAQVESGNLKLDIEKVSLNDIIDECLSLLQGQAEEQCVKLENEIDNSIVVKAAHIKLKQIMINLINNAIKYNKQDGKVILSTENIGNGYIKINVRDTGIGIAKEKYDQVFTAFSRLGHEASQIEGTGIGLVIIKSMVEAMDGQVGFESIDGKGSTFWFTLPSG